MSFAPACEFVHSPDTPVCASVHDSRIVVRCVLVALALGCAWPLSLNLVDPDLWGHVLYAQDWLADGQLPRTATHTFTAIGHPWINHENLAELFLAVGYELCGVQGLLVIKCLLGMGITLAVAWLAHRRGVHPLVTWTWLLLVTTNLQPFFLLRPQLLSFVLCAIVLILLELAFEPWETEHRVRPLLLWCLPVVIAVWVNSHGGFLAGLAIVGTYLGGRLLEAFYGAWRKQCGCPWHSTVHIVPVGLACLAVTLVNPYGLELIRWLAVSLSQPRPEITEWLPPRPGDAVFTEWAVLVTLAAAALVGTRERRDWVQIAILLIVGWQSAMHLRHIAFVALLCGFWIPRHLQSALARLRPEGSAGLADFQFSKIGHRLLLATLLVCIALESAALANRLRSLPVERNRFPVDALQYMADRGLDGKLVVSFNWAQYAIAALAPNIQVAFDGRFDTCYPLEVVDMHFDFLLGEWDGKRYRQESSGPVDGTRVLRHENPDLVLIDRQYEHPVEIMKREARKENPDWTLLYCDQVAELWGRSDRFDDPVSEHYMPPRMRVLDPSPRLGSIAWPALPLPVPDDLPGQPDRENATSITQNAAL